MSLRDELLAVLRSFPGNYSSVSQQAQKKASPREIKATTLRRTLTRLRANGLVVNKKGEWSITPAGKESLQRKLSLGLMRPRYGDHFLRNNKRNNKRNIVIAFDIPESKRRKRAWLRRELLFLNFTSLQKSVWLGPAPLPQEFVECLAALNLTPYLKFFRANEQEII